MKKFYICSNKLWFDIYCYKVILNRGELVSLWMDSGEEQEIGRNVDRVKGKSENRV